MMLRLVLSVSLHHREVPYWVNLGVIEFKYVPLNWRYVLLLEISK